jgi:hypothetical protein
MMTSIIIIIIITNFWRQKCDQERSRESFQYKYLIKDIQRMWNVNTKVIPVITGASGTISKSLRQYLCNIQEEARN